MSRHFFNQQFKLSKEAHFQTTRSSIFSHLDPSGLDASQDNILANAPNFSQTFTSTLGHFPGACGSKDGHFHDSKSPFNAISSGRNSTYGIPMAVTHPRTFSHSFPEILPMYFPNLEIVFKLRRPPLQLIAPLRDAL